MSERINKKLAEISSRNSVELKAEVLELNMMKDFNSALSAAESGKTKVLKSIPNVSPLIKQAENSRRDWSLAGSHAEKLNKALKELGLPPDKKASMVIKKWKSNAQEMDKIANSLKPLSKL